MLKGTNKGCDTSFPLLWCDIVAIVDRYITLFELELNTTQNHCYIMMIGTIGNGLDHLVHVCSTYMHKDVVS